MSELTEYLEKFTPDFLKDYPNTATEAAHRAAVEIERLRAENARLREALTWQPIETAPPTRLLLFGNSRHDAGVVFTGWKALNGRIYADNGDSVKATHWMLPPEPPGQNADRS